MDTFVLSMIIACLSFGIFFSIFLYLDYSFLYHHRFSEKYKPSCIDFEYGPAELNLYDYIAMKARFLWTKTKTYFILKAESEPRKGVLLFHTEEENLSEVCKKHFEFDLHSTTFSKGNVDTSNLFENDLIRFCRFTKTQTRFVLSISFYLLSFIFNNTSYFKYVMLNQSQV